MGGYLLAGDIGGTKANLVLVDPAGDPRRSIAAARIPTADHPTLEALLDAFRAQSGLTPAKVCLGIPSPVIDGRVAPVNIHWQADERLVAHHLGLEPSQVRFLNDLEATALGIPELRDDELLTLHPGNPRELGVKAVVAPGTGLGTGWLARDGERWRAFPSEGGHADFAPRGERQRRIQGFLANAAGQANVESVCSGKGITNLWRFFGTAEGGNLRDSAAVEAAAAAAGDPTPVVMQAAADAAANPRSVATAQEFVAILFQEAGNSALRWLATGGVYLAGGVPPKVLPWLQRPGALESYFSNPQLGRMIREMPLRVVLNESTAVLGAIAGGRGL